MLVGEGQGILFFSISITHISSLSTSIHIQFFAFLGLLCSEGEGVACDKLTSEIMITGYCIMALLVSCITLSDSNIPQ